MPPIRMSFPCALKKFPTFLTKLDTLSVAESKYFLILSLKSLTVLITPSKMPSKLKKGLTTFLKKSETVLPISILSMLFTRSINAAKFSTALFI